MRLAIALLFLLLPISAQAEDVQFSKGQAVSLMPDKAYLLVQTNDIGKTLGGTWFVSPVLYRVLNQEEQQQLEAVIKKDPVDWQSKADPNVVVIVGSNTYEESGAGRFLLVATRPGAYILGGAATTNGSGDVRGVMISCLCMGTVEFEAKPGVITDMGAVLAARDSEPTTIPELVKVVTGKETEINYGYVNDVAIRPAAPSSHVPQGLRELPRALADYHAVPAIPNYSGARLNRLAPLPGVLDYDKDGEVIDLKAAKSP